MTSFTAPAHIQARVTWDARRQRPASVITAGRRFAVARLVARREEIAAFPASRGPRVIYLLSTDGGEIRLVFDVRLRQWHVEEEALAQAA
jgi:hypothetical protein